MNDTFDSRCIVDSHQLDDWIGVETSKINRYYRRVTVMPLTSRELSGEVSPCVRS